MANERIIGGTPVKDGPNSYPYYVHTVDAGSLCGATLIYEDIAMSSAGCQKRFGDGVTVYLGSLLRNGSDALETNKVVRSVIHPDFNIRWHSDDIRLLKLENASSITPVTLAASDRSDDPAQGDKVTTIGFGRTSDEGDFSEDLLEVTIDVYSDKDCRHAYRCIGNDMHLCAGTKSGGMDTW